MKYYYPELDGLRALAVAVVLLFHAGVPGASGGFVGVDLFFVLSGYLITGRIYKSLAENNFSFKEFYVGRVRRLFPAFAFVCFASSVMACWALTPEQLDIFGRSLWTSLASVHNWQLLREWGYFDVSSEEKLLLHMWSLSVEEQFYIFVPPALWLFHKLGRRFLFVSLWLMMIGSFFLANSGGNINTKAPFIDPEVTFINVPPWAFYATITRMWEMLAGGLLACHMPSLLRQRGQPSAVSAEIIVLLSCLVMVYCVVSYDHHTAHPSAYTLLPVMACLGFIAFANRSYLARMAFTAPAVRHIGVVSYSTYLWHQPILASLRASHVEKPSLSIMCLGLLLSLALGHFTCKWVENRWRYPQESSRLKISTTAAWLFSVAALITIGWWFQLSKGWPGRYSDSQADMKALAVPSPARLRCHADFNNGINASNACVYGPTDQVHWAVIGDSHVMELGYALGGALAQKTNAEGLLHMSFSMCAPAIGFQVPVEGCQAWLGHALDRVESSPNIKNVLVGFRYSAFLFGSHRLAYPDLPHEPPKIIANGKTDDQMREIYVAGLSKMIRSLTQAGKVVYLIYPVPELPFHIDKIIYHDPERSDGAGYKYFESRNRYILTRLDKLVADNSRVRAIRPTQVLCGYDTCAAKQNGVPLYFDDNHLSVSGAQLVANQVLEASSTP